jgi:hypothetical protein
MSSFESLEENDVVAMLIELTRAARDGQDFGAIYMSTNEAEEFFNFMLSQEVEEGNVDAQ